MIDPSTAGAIRRGRSETSWTTVLDVGEAAKAMAVARDVVTRFRDPAGVDRAVSVARAQTAFPRSVHWQSHGIAQGYAGIALLCGAADASMPGEGWDVVAHQHLTCAVRAAEQVPRLSCSMFAGVGGLAFAAWYLSRLGARYSRLLRTLDTAVLHRVRSAVATPAHTEPGLSVSTFDVISGLAGVGRLLLLRPHLREHRLALDAVLRQLVSLTEEGDGAPRWHTPAQFLADETMRISYPHGNLNCGLAHGIPGPLALLSLAAIAGVLVDGQMAAIRRAADWLCRHRLWDQWGVNWPTAVPLGPRGAPQAPPGHAPDQDAGTSLQPSRAAWCYGTPGIARSLWLAGRALNDPDYQNLAIDAMDAVYRRPLFARHIDSPTFCHGVAGLQQITLRFAHDSGLPVFIEAGRALHGQLMEAYEPDSLLGYRNLEPRGGRVDQPGLLDGAPGVALVLLAAARPVQPVWDHVFLLS